MATNRKSGTKKATKPKSLMSPKTAAFYALNDILTLHADDAEPSPEVIAGRKTLVDHGFEARPSRAQEIARIEEQIKAIDATQPGAAATMIELGKSLGAAQRGKIQAKKKTKSAEATA